MNTSMNSTPYIDTGQRKILKEVPPKQWQLFNNLNKTQILIERRCF